MKKKVKSAFPDSLYIWWDEDGNESYPVPALNPNKITGPDGIEVGVYALQTVGKLTKTITIE